MRIYFLQMPKTYLFKPTKAVKQPVPVANVQIVEEVPDDEQLTLQGNIKCEVVEEDEEVQIIQEEDEQHEAVENVIQEMSEMGEEEEIIEEEAFITEHGIHHEIQDEGEEVYLNEVTLEDNVNEVTLEDDVNEVTIDESKLDDEEVEEETVILNVLDQ